ncbi:MAG TPA: DegT/DnrJ/EryC1/StrS family aminotransferase [Candidatus Polarisedimenticolaceae bacterium]
MKPVPLLDLKPQLAAIKEDVYKVLHDVVDSQYFILGPNVEAFEKEAAAFLGARHAIGCASGTDALILSLNALGVRGGDEVVTTPFSFFASASCAALLGAKPVFADVDPRTFNLDPASLEASITPKTKAIVAVHLFGQCADMDAILEIGERRGLPVVEDACQSMSATFESKRLSGRFEAGAMGTFGTFSFFPSKNLGAFGDGGLVTTNDDRLAAVIRQTRVHGERVRYHHEIMGWNSRLDALQAAVLRVKLPHLRAWSEGRRRNADLYDRLFRASGLVERGAITLPHRDPRCGHIFNQYTLRVRDRDALGAFLKDRQIGWAIYYPIPLHLQECFASLGYRPGDLPVAEKAAAEVISLPIFPELSTEQIETVAAAVAEFYSKG